MNILGINAYYHDSAVALIRDGEIIAAAQEERFTRKKHDSSFPVNAMRYCLAEGKVAPDGIDAVAFYDKPMTKFARVLETFLGVAPKGIRSFMMAMPVWMKHKLRVPMEIEKNLNKYGFKMPELLCFPEHHESHAASAFFPSPFKNAAVLTIDGVGEWATTTLGHGEDNKIEILEELRFPHSLGLLYSAFTCFTGFRVNSGEYKLMGLAPYGEPKYVKTIMDNLVDLRDDGSFKLNLDYFNYYGGQTVANKKFSKLFGGPPRKPETEITKREMDLAKSIQVVTEEIVIKMARHLRQKTNEKYLCLAGGVALNCVANGRLLREKIFDDIWIQPAASDAGGALGAALVAWHMVKNQPRKVDGVNDCMKGSYIGPEFADDAIEEYLKEKGYSFRKMEKDERAKTIARIIDEQNVVGLLQGRMEFGPRALGNRSIIGDPRSPKMQSIMNLKIKHRESFRPFAPSCLEGRVSDFFDLDRPSPYMLLVANVQEARRKKCEENDQQTLKQIINMQRSDVPAITHVDYSARIQTVSYEENPLYHDIIKAFEDLTGYGVIINTSFNVRGEPIVCTPEDAYRCFMRTEMDYLVLGSFLLDKKEQPEWQGRKDWREEFVLD